MDSDADVDASKLTFGALSAPLLQYTLSPAGDDSDVQCVSTSHVYQLLRNVQKERQQTSQDDDCEVFEKMVKYSKKFGAGWGAVPFAGAGNDGDTTVVEGLDALAEALYSVTFAMPNQMPGEGAPAAFRALPNKLHSFEVAQIINLTLQGTTSEELVCLIPSLERIGLLQLEDMLEKVQKQMKKLVEG
jgi:hypothetical protein